MKEIKVMVSCGKFDLKRLAEGTGKSNP